MNQSCDLPLDSYRLAHYSVQVECYVCEGGNTFDAELCRHCQAPMALAHQANSQKVQPGLVAVLGTSGAGKTVYLGMLMDMLSRRTAGLQALVRGAFSVSLQQVTTSALANGEFPGKTPNEPDRWNWVHAQLSGSNLRQPMELIIPDMAGEAVMEEIEHPRAFPVIRSFMAKSSGVVILIDAIRLQHGGHEQDHFTTKLLTFLDELDTEQNQSKSKRKKQTTRPVALVLTKADQCDKCFEDPVGFAQTYASGMWRHCQERFSEVNVFAAGVAGACAYRYGMGNQRRRVPLHVEPRGIIEPFDWLISRVAANSKRRSWAGRATASLVQ